MEGTALHGLPLLKTVLFEIKNHEHLVTTMQQHMVYSYIPINDEEGILGESQQYRNRNNHVTERDRMQEERCPLPFRGDNEPDAPPLAWTLIWDNTYSNLYGWCIPNEMRRWGYAIWDEATLENIGGREFIKAQWEARWRGDDPRDDL